MLAGILCRIIGSQQTNTMRAWLPNRKPIFSASLCLLAVILLYAPFAATAWTARGMACCAGDHCPIPQHHHQKAPVAPDVVEDCVHNMGGLTACTMSCCHPSDRPVVVSIAFVLPASPSVPALATAMRSGAQLKQLELPRSSQPLSPPPRVSTATL